MSSREFAEWQAYYRHDPFGLNRGDYQAAMICWTVYNMLRGKAAALPLSEFLPVFGPSGEIDVAEKFSQQMSLLAGG